MGAGVDREGLAVLDREECVQRLAGASVGRFVFVHRGQPLALPVNHAVVDEAVVFRVSEGSKLDAARQQAGARVAFEVDGFDPDEETGWSVLVKGTVHPVTDEVEARRLDRLDLYPWAEVAERSHWIRIDVDEITGRRLLPLADEAR